MDMQPLPIEILIDKKFQLSKKGGLVSDDRKVENFFTLLA